MKTILKALLPIALCAASSAYANDCGGHGQDSYYYDSVPNGTNVTIVLQGAGKVPLAKMFAGSGNSVGQDFLLASNCSFTSYIYSENNEGRTNLYTITGTWSYPAESKTIYFALDGDISQGSNVENPDATTWGRLLAGGLGIPNVMPLIFGPEGLNKIQGFKITSPSITTKIATIVPGKNGTAKATMSIVGKGVVTDKAGKKKEASFSFTSTVKATGNL